MDAGSNSPSLVSAPDDTTLTAVVDPLDGGVTVKVAASMQGRLGDVGDETLNNTDEM